MEELDIWRTAATLMCLHGDGAAFNAAQRADELFAKDDFVGCVVWMKVIRAIEELDRQMPNAGEALN